MNSHSYLAVLSTIAVVTRVSAAPQAACHSGLELIKRDDCLCAFPQDEGLVAITPGYGNAGWAMSPDQRCKCGSYCPYACPAGSLPGQWSPGATVYQNRMDGGYHCSESGSLELPRPDHGLCLDARGEISVRWEGGQSSFLCQTVFPGNENMLVPTEIPAGSSVQLAIAGAEHFPDVNGPAGAHFYANEPGHASDEACAWGSNASPIGNWAPYTVGTGRGAGGDVFLSLGWNPIYLEYESVNRGVRPSFGVRFQCLSAGCGNIECGIDPSVYEVNQMSGSSVVAVDSAKGPGHVSCTSSIPSGVQVEVVLFMV